MKQRVITALVLIPVLFLIALAAPKIVAAVVWGVLMMIGEYELLFNTGMVRHPRMLAYAAVMAFATSMWSYYGAIQGYWLIGVIIFWMLTFGELMANHVKISVEMVAETIFAGVVIPYLLCALIRILGMTNGRYLIPVPFVVAFMSDAGAYFAGSFFGRHKLAPVVSPNKTIEGVAGGIICAMVGMLLYGILMQLVFHLNVHYGAALLYGLLGSAVGVFGDLCFSVIKRQSGIKDYGRWIPGHGGFFDRFDSMVTVAPLIEALILLIPVVS